MLLDLRYALRTLGRSPGFTAAILLLFTAGIGASTAVFSVLHGVLLRSLPYEDAEQLVRVRLNAPSGIRGPISVLDYRDLAAGMRSATLAAYQGWMFHRRSESGKEPVPAARVTASFFDVLKIRPAIGRVFTAEEDKPGGDPVCLVSHRFWTDRLGANPQAIGRLIALDGAALTVIGVMPPGFAFRSPDVDIWTPIRLGDDTHRLQRSENYLTVIGRLRGNLESASREGAAVIDELARRYPATNGGLGIRVENLRETMTGEVRAPLLLLFAAVSLVLLIACVNGGHLMLARAASRSHDFAVRRALGATTWRIVRHQLALSVLLSAVAAVLSLLAAAWLIDALRPLLPDALPRRSDIGISREVLLFALLAALLTSILAAVAPAIRASHVHASSRMTSRWSGIPLGAQIAFSFVLLAGAAALLQSLYSVLSADPGFRKERVLTVPVTMASGGAAPAVHFEELLRHIQQMPGFTTAGAVVGVVADMRQNELDQAAEPEIFQPHRQFPWPRMHVVVRTTGDAAAVWPSLRSAILAFDGDQTLGEVRALEDLIDNNVRVRRFYTWLLAAFAAVGALLVAIGLHASLAFTVAQRMREIGIRLALGADCAAIVRVLAASVTLPLTAGLFTGIAAGAAAMRAFASLIYGDRTASPFATAGLVVLVLVLFASAQPALRALRVDPSEALRAE